MISRKFFAGILALSSTLMMHFQSAEAAPQGLAQKPTQYLGPDARVPDQLIVQFKPGLSAARINELLGTVKAKMSDNLVHSCYRVKFDPGLSGAAYQELKKSNEVQAVSANYYLTACALNNPTEQKLPMEPSYAMEWHLSAVHAVHKQPKAGHMPIYLIDTGAPYPNQAPDIECSVYDCYMGQEWGGDGDFNPGHGSMMASTIAAKWNNIGTAGVHSCPKFICNRVPKYGQGKMTEADILKGFGKIWSPGVGVINTIVIPYNAPTPYSLSSAAAHPVFHNIAKLFYENNGSMIFLSAGNEGKLDPNPACNYLNVVTASGKDGKLLPTSNFGNCVTFMAPGEQIKCQDKMGNVITGNGTSFATAIAGSLATLIFDKSNDGPHALALKTNMQVLQLMKDTCQGGASAKTGFGIPDYAKAVKQMPK